jgi:hypothetical protein
LGEIEESEEMGMKPVITIGRHDGGSAQKWYEPKTQVTKQTEDMGNTLGCEPDGLERSGTNGRTSTICFNGTRGTEKFC